MALGYTQWGDPIQADASGGCFYQDPDTGDNISVACPSGGGGTPTVYTPSISVNPGGFQVNQTPLDKILSSILSFSAIAKGAAYVPTTTQPVNNTLDPNVAAIAALQRQSGGIGITGGSNISGQLQSILQKNPGTVALALGGLILFMMRPPSRAR